MVAVGAGAEEHLSARFFELHNGWGWLWRGHDYAHPCHQEHRLVVILLVLG
uniref:Uncharacterized protein n=1 Tax=Arundo donax TaxID=35708 RepID=A0A0A9B8Z5_ARUDO